MESKKTAFYNLHLKHGAKMVEFAGHYMPVQYSSILEEHKKVRTSVGVFDVSHMGEIEISGDNALNMVNRLTTNNIEIVFSNQAQYNAMCYENGGIVDDLIVYNRGDKYLLVVNASNIQKDYQWMIKNKIDGVKIENISDSISQLAIQGKNAEPTLQKLTKVDLSEIKFYWFVENTLADVEMIISRTGYTGEPGFELYFNKEYSEEVWNAVMKAGKEFDISPIGLGARDSLRLEKKFCLYGNDMDDSTNPYEAGLGWITKLDKGDFLGKSRLIKIKEEGVNKKLVGFEIDGRMIPRKGYDLQKEGKKIGTVTSGCYSPILEKNIGLGYVDKENSQVGTKIIVNSKGREVNATIVKTPFV